MTYYRTIVHTGGHSWDDTNTLENVAIRMKRKRQEMDTLSANYEILQEKLSEVVLRQKEASKEYKELKDLLVSLADSIDQPDDED